MTTYRNDPARINYEETAIRDNGIGTGQTHRESKMVPRRERGVIFFRFVIFSIGLLYSLGLM